jgi:hypothetical protein
MGLQDFWMNVRKAAGLAAPLSIADSPRIDSEIIEESLRRTELWLTPHAIDGYCDADFAFLSDAERARMAHVVAEFRDVVAKVYPTAPAPAQVKESALPLLRDLVQMLEFDRFADPEAFRLGKQIERELEPYWPPELAELRFKSGLDATGDPGLWIWVFLNEEASREDQTFLEAAARLKGVVDPIARQIAPDRWPYLSFRPINEPEEAVASEVR